MTLPTSSTSTTSERESPAAGEELLPGYYVEPGTGAWLTLPPFPVGDLPTIGYDVAWWIEGRGPWADLPPPRHHLSGERLVLRPGQLNLILWWYALGESATPERPRWRSRSGVKRGAKGPIAHDTPVMTPGGWVAHGDLRAGDQVYAPDGSVTTVLAVHEPVLEPCFEIAFRDGARVVSTGSHRWPVDEFTGRGRRARTATVNEMAATGVVYERRLTSGRTKATRGGVARWRAAVSPPVSGEVADFPIPPYILGYWLGDGDHETPRITAHRDDLPSLIAEFDAAGVEHGAPSWTHLETFRIRFGRGWAAQALRAAGLIRNKHIPPRLLRASLDQRWALLQGLIDSDGTVDAKGQVEIALAAGRLADDVFELAVSLGLMPHRTVGPTRLDGRACRDRVRIRFTPQPGEIVSRLPRKFARTQRARRHSSPFSRSRTIIDIRPVEPVPARCITVAHPSHQYLVGDRNVPTCNTGKDPLLAALALAELCGPTLPVWRQGRWVGEPHRMALVQIGANSEAQAKDPLAVANAMVDRDMASEYGFDKGILRTQLRDGGRIEVLTTSEASAEGDPSTAIFLNETHHLKSANGGDLLAGVARRNVGKSPGGMARILEFTNAHMPGEDSVAEQSYDAWQAQVSGKTKRIDILYDSREAPPHLSLQDEAQLMEGLAAAYHDSPWSDLDRIAGEAQDLRTPIADSIRYYFSSLPTAATSWADPRKFDSLARPDTVVEPTDGIALFLDCSKSRDATTLVGSRIDDGHVLALGEWQRPHGAREWQVPRSEVDAKVREVFKAHDVQWFGVDPSPAVEDDTEMSYWAALVDAWHRDFRETVLVWATPGAKGSAVSYDLRQHLPGGRERLRDFTAEAEKTADAIEEQKLTWDGNPVLRLHVHNARRRPNQFGVSLGKKSRDSTQLVDYAVSMVGARLGRRLVLNSGKTRKKRTGRASF